MEGVSQHSGAGCVRITNYNIASAIVLFSLVTSALLPFLMLVVTSNWTIRNWIFSISITCIVAAYVLLDSVARTVEIVLENTSKTAKVAAKISGVLLFAVIGWFMGKSGIVTFYVVPFFLVGWAFLIFGILPRTILWIEVGETVGMRRFIARKDYKWDDVKSITFSDSQTKVGISFLKAPIVKHRFLEMIFSDGFSAKLKINRNDLIAIRTSIEHNNAIHLLSEKKEHSEEEFEYPV
jgi:hypothetical protein